VAALRRSVELAAAARDDLPADRPRWVAASVGPYGAALADGSEYRGDYGRSVAELRDWHRPRLHALMDTDADVLALETIPCLAEVEALLAEVSGTGAPCWLSLTCTDGRTRAGEPLGEAFAMAAEVEEVVAVGVNCCAPGDVAAAVATAVAASGRPAVAYPNSGESWDAGQRRWIGDPTFTPGQVGTWLAAGARLVGGCCRVRPEGIAGIRAAAGPLGVR
jgi:homocysteine S-methyltransferase